MREGVAGVPGERGWWAGAPLLPACAPPAAPACWGRCAMLGHRTGARGAARPAAAARRHGSRRAAAWRSACLCFLQPSLSGRCNRLADVGCRRAAAPHTQHLRRQRAGPCPVLLRFPSFTSAPASRFHPACCSKSTNAVLLLQACAERVEKDESGEAHCTGQYFGASLTPLGWPRCRTAPRPCLALMVPGLGPCLAGVVCSHQLVAAPLRAAPGTLVGSSQFSAAAAHLTV